MNRHRFIYLFLTRQTDLLNSHGKKMLHIAPEPELAPIFRRLVGPGYLTADLFDPHAMVRMDITDIQYPASSFNIVYCSHVLEHVPDDRKAMREFRRVLTPDGWALVVVPVNVPRTVEDPTITDPAERQRLFGQVDHVRRYGPDVEDRLKEAGFDVETIHPHEAMETSERERCGITETEILHFCRPK